MLEAWRSFHHHGIHNFAIGTLDTYFKLSDLVGRKLVSYGPRGIVLGGATKKVFVYDSQFAIDKLETLQRSGYGIYSQRPLKLSKESKFVEVAYLLPSVFDPSAYPNAKKRNQRIRYPFTWLERQGIECAPLLATDIPEVTALHKAWVDKKLADPDTFRHMFPQQRYLRCARVACGVDLSSITTPADYATLTFKRAGAIVAVRVLAVDGPDAFDLAFFGDTWSPSQSQAFVYFNVVTMASLYANGCKALNCGASLNTALKAFKTHYPNTEVVSYAYGRLKEIIDDKGLFG